MVFTTSGQQLIKSLTAGTTATMSNTCGRHRFMHNSLLKTGNSRHDAARLYHRQVRVVGSQLGAAVLQHRAFVAAPTGQTSTLAPALRQPVGQHNQHCQWWHPWSVLSAVGHDEAGCSVTVGSSSAASDRCYLHTSQTLYELHHDLKRKQPVWCCFVPPPECNAHVPKSVLHAVCLSCEAHACLTWHCWCVG